ncbi:sigma-70 family RNA polymerase sigma factor [Sinomicrobium pectinilyticum]|uniref:Sigma-70 family RNA polymerase sigma factor n=1 Tax=Sinomicrobium pectinilyticum TaxID=1084421 RepID=A0A3N0EJ04_SINP1|nr:sigma-70 family RNA polymerase sigma factor [Sinomicrobium pectinilyticum]RNL87896.1 sigma-70 family RNA polymerase sigma factor [Sinomicrobium pectinilyticum]
MGNSDKSKIDQDLVRSLKQGDLSAFETIFHLLERKLYYVVFSYTKSTYISEEIVQEVFIKIWEIREELDPSRSFIAFIFTMAKNHAFNYMRDAARRKLIREELWENIAVQYEQVESQYLLKEYGEIIEKIIAGLPARKQSVYNLSRKEGKSHAEISEILGMSVKRVKNHLWEISEIIKKELRPYINNILFLIFK